jgi:hypothetical protein
MKTVMTGSRYPFGLDCVWLAADRNGHVGAFVTAGFGPIPARALIYEQGSIEDIEGCVNELPRVSLARLLISGDVPSFIAMAERGLFVFDWQHVHRSLRDYTRKYEPVAAPVNPIMTADLPGRLVGFAASVTLDQVDFAVGQALDIFSLVECREGPASG